MYITTEIIQKLPHLKLLITHLQRAGFKSHFVYVCARGSPVYMHKFDYHTYVRNVYILINYIITYSLITCLLVSGDRSKIGHRDEINKRV